MRRFFQWVTLHPVPVLVTASVAGLVLTGFILTLTRDTRPDAFIPEGHPALLLKQEVDERFDLAEPIVVGVIRNEPDGIFNPHSLELIQRLTRDIQDLVEQVAERPEGGETQESELTADDVMSLATESGVYFEEGWPAFEPLMEEVPTTPEGIARLKQDVFAYELYRGTLVAADGSAAAILIRCGHDAQAERLYRALRDLLDGYPVEDERLVVAGEAAVRSHMGNAVSDDALRMNFICPVVMMLLIILAYRTPRGTILPICVIGGASAAALGSMAAAGVPVYIVTNGIFVVIMALGVADSLHLLGQYYEEQLDLRNRSRQQVIVDACMALWFPLLVTTLTDMAGFFALFLAGEMPPIRYFGLFTCVGVFGALVYSYTVVPAGLAILPLEQSRTFLRRKAKQQTEAIDDEEHPRAQARSAPAGVDSLGRTMGGLGALVYRRRYAVLLVSTAVLAVAVWGALKLRVNDARLLAFKEHHPIVQATRALNARFDGTSQLNIVVTASEEGAFIQPDVLERIDALEDFTETLPHVGGTHSVAGWVKRAHQKLNEEKQEFYAIPEDPEDSRFYLDQLGMETCPMSPLLHEVVDDTYTETNLIVRMTSSQYVHQREVIEKLERYLDEHFSDGTLTATLAGRVNLDYHWLQLIRVSHIRSVCISFGCVLLLTGLMFRSMVAGVFCALPVAAAVVVNYAVMGLSGISLGVGTSMFASIAVGAGVNFPIHLLDRLRIGLRRTDAEPQAVFRNTLAFTGRALFFTAFIVAVGFLLLVVSEFRTLIRFGLLIGLGMVVSFLASVTMLPALIAALRPAAIWPHGKGDK